MDSSSDGVAHSYWGKQHLDWVWMEIRKQRLDEELSLKHQVLLLLLAVWFTCNTPAAPDRRDLHAGVSNEQPPANGRKQTRVEMVESSQLDGNEQLK